MKTSSSADSKYLRRLPRWKLRGTLLGIAAIIASGILWQLQQPPRGTALYLQEGKYRVATVLDAITFECEPIGAQEPFATQGSAEVAEMPRLTVRLWGVELLVPQRPGDPANAAALRCTLEFLRQAPEGVVELRFEPYRFDRTMMPRARMFVGGIELNQRLQQDGWVQAAAIPGMRRESPGGPNAERPRGLKRRTDQVEGVVRE